MPKTQGEVNYLNQCGDERRKSKAGRKPKRYYIKEDPVWRDTWYVFDRTVGGDPICRTYNRANAVHVCACLNAAEVA